MKAITALALVSVALASPQRQQGGKSNGEKSGGAKSGGGGGLASLLSGLGGGGAPGTDPLGGVAGMLGGAGGAIGGLVTAMNRGYGKVPDPAGAAARRVNLTPRVKYAGAKTTKIRYGPYKIPSVNTKSVMGEGGTLYNYPHTNVERPCSGDCMILGINAGLEYPDGKNANINTGLWLHHMVLLAVGPGRQDATCMNNRASLPHMLVGSTATGSERIFSSGNERTPAFPAEWGIGGTSGIKLSAADKFSMIVDLMNTESPERVAYLTLTYDWVQGTPADIDEIRVVWFDVAQCGTSEVIPKAQTGAWTVSAPTWVANFNGQVIGSAGHLHDGGTNVHLLVDGKLVCDSKATYGGSPEFIGKAMGGGHHGGASPHISNMTVCIGGTDSFKQKEVETGQKWVLQARYDYDKYPGMSHGDDGKQSNVMGIAIMFVRVKKS